MTVIESTNHPQRLALRHCAMLPYNDYAWHKLITKHLQWPTIARKNKNYNLPKISLFNILAHNSGKQIMPVMSCFEVEWMMYLASSVCKDVVLSYCMWLCFWEPWDLLNQKRNFRWTVSVSDRAFSMERGAPELKSFPKKVGSHRD